ncbi:MAG: toxin-antitoxin system YwqK family antitoxin [Cetobacterium sp.]|uniref:toxin-antitoxin system YwqK family antitoxin n=1 Tax=Cetobacterium sp. TaxID=2071632 RepID=UPI002FCAC58B
MIKKISLAFFILFKFSFSELVQVDYSKILNKNGKIFVKNLESPLTGMVKYKKDREFYKNGIPEGKWLSFYSNGKIKSIENWKNGELNGKYILYSEDGYKTFQTYYLKGKDHGLFKLYHDNGKLHIVGNFYNGQAIGIWNYYNERGNLIGKLDYSKREHFDQSN